MYLDSHAHLEVQHFGAEVDAVLARAQEAGLTAVLAIGNGSRENPGHREVQSLTRKYGFVYAAVGVHPHEAAQSDSPFLEELEDTARENPRIVAWGEIGLDYHYDFSPRDTQRQVFEAQLEKAHKLALPVIVHSREAEEDTLALLRPWVRSCPWGVLHCFSGSREFARRGMDLGLLVSFSGMLTFKKAHSLEDIARTVPGDRLLVESDCPYLAPVPWRGRRNEPAWVSLTTQRLVELQKVPLAKMQNQLLDNFSRLFNVNIPYLGN